MAAGVVVDGVALRASTPAFDLRFGAGHAWAIMGPGGAGKSTLLSWIAGRARPPIGSVQVGGEVAEASLAAYGRRGSPQAVARRLLGRPTLAAEALSALGLWEARRLPIGQLSESLQGAAALLPLFAPEARVLLCDGWLDRVCPWSLAEALGALMDRTKDGATLLIATHRVDIGDACGDLVVLKSGTLRYEGSVEDLLNRARPAEVTVETGEPGAVRALCDPFTLSVEETDGGLRMQAVQGQALAAKLLVEGYGQVRTVTLKRVGLLDALRTL